MPSLSNTLLSETDRKKLSPMMQQYVQTKDGYPDCLLFYRLGDFYEMFFDDAVTASKELDLTLTGRDCGLGERAPMCGVPFHAVDTYIAKLIEKGYKVAVCEQVTQPGKKLMDREITRVVTPGTLVDSVMLNEEKNNYLVSAALVDGYVGIAYTDISTGEFFHTSLDSRITVKINEILSRIAPSEIICNESMLAESINLSIVKYGSVCPFTLFDETAFCYENAVIAVKNKFDEQNFKLIDKNRAATCAVGALLEYLDKTQKRSLININKSEEEKLNGVMSIDTSARRTLELVENAATGKKYGSLLWLIDRTSTKMGARKLRNWLEMPSTESAAINMRLDATEELFSDIKKRTKSINILSKICDIERICGRLSFGNVSPKDILALGQTLILFPELKELLSSLESKMFALINSKIGDLYDLGSLIVNAISEKTAPTIREGGVIKDGFNAKLDEYRNISTNTQSVLEQLAAAEKEETGIKNLRIAYNKVFGYYIEVPKGQISLVPYRYVRKQTTVNSERYITEELKELETKILSAAETAIKLEVELFNALTEQIKTRLDELTAAARAVAALDCVTSNSTTVAREYDFVKPIINDQVTQIKIIGGRHPVVEKLLKSESFVPNDALLNDESNIMLITGPNMAGKSVYMKQVALITVLAHIGSFVPAKSAEISIVDKLFTRVGASDDLGTGRSTFMVEMSEVSYILSNITDKSLILLDEIGRGTSTYDGLSIAWAIIEYISQNFNAKTLFSTHYHELTELEGILKGVKNYKLTLKEKDGNIVFLRKLMRGSANKSFGIEVAGLAGLPKYVISRAKELLASLEKADIMTVDPPIANQQISLFNNLNNNAEINAILTELDLDEITPQTSYGHFGRLKGKGGKKQWLKFICLTAAFIILSLQAK